MKQTILVVISLLVGAFARDFAVSRAGAEEDALRRSDVTSIVRALEAQARASEKQADAMRDVGRAVGEVSRKCK